MANDTKEQKVSNRLTQHQFDQLQQSRVQKKMIYQSETTSGVPPICLSKPVRKPCKNKLVSCAIPSHQYQQMVQVAQQQRQSKHNTP